MNNLLEKRYVLVLMAAIVFSILGCNDKMMTYPEFLSRFQQQCPDYYLIKVLAPQQRQGVCDCMLKTTQQNYPDMTSLLAGIRALDREPRGETDYVPSAIRMAAATCMQGK